MLGFGKKKRKKKKKKKKGVKAGKIVMAIAVSISTGIFGFFFFFFFFLLLFIGRFPFSGRNTPIFGQYDHIQPESAQFDANRRESVQIREPKNKKIKIRRGTSAQSAVSPAASRVGLRYNDPIAASMLSRLLHAKMEYKWSVLLQLQYWHLYQCLSIVTSLG